MVATPVAPGVTQVEAEPPSSVTVLHDDAPPQAARVALLLVLQPMVAPLTGVTPSAATTCTLTGLVACTPTGVRGFNPEISNRLSVAAAPYVTALVMVEKAPLTGSLIVTLCGPSPCGGSTRIICPAFTVSGLKL